MFCFKLLPQLFQAANVLENNTHPPPLTETTVIKSDSGETGLLPPKPLDVPFPRAKGLGYREGEIGSCESGSHWSLGPGTGKRGGGRLCKHMLGIR